MAPDLARDRVLTLLRRHGWNATSFQVLEPAFHHWFDGDDACVGYVDTGRAWVAAGAPIAPTARLAEVATRFDAAARAAGRRTAWFATERRFSEATGWPALRIGDQPVWSPAEWAAVVKSSRGLREQLRRARAKGVVVRAVGADELVAGHATRAGIEALIARWQASRPMAPMSFLVQLDPFSFAAERRTFVAERDGAVVALLGIIPIYARDGWFFEDFVRDPDAPNGTVELLVDAGMRAAAAADVPLVTLGLAPLAGEVPGPLRAARKLGRPLYDFDGLRAFKAKFRPGAWDPVYLTYPPGRRGVGALLDALRAFAGGGLVRFGLATAHRTPLAWRLAFAAIAAAVAVALVLALA